jgi:hypothetical protein
MGPVRRALVLLAGCSFTHGVDPSIGTSVALVDDSAADFAAGTPSDMTVDTLGLLAPEAYQRGGLHASGYTTYGITTTTTWADLTPALLGPLTGEGYGSVPADWSYDHPYGLGLTNRVDYFTVVYDGELYLPDGPTTLQLDADDVGFLEIDLGAIRTTVRATYNTPGQVTVTPPAAGWYPVRGAMSEIGYTARFVVSTVAQSVATPIKGDRLRARVTNARGAIVAGAYDRIFVGLSPTTSADSQLVTRDFAGQAPAYDLLGLSTTFALRYSAQLRIDAQGTYTFALDVGPDLNDYTRLSIDGTLIAGHWPGQLDKPSEAVALAPGWHDVELDYSSASNADRIALTMATFDSYAKPIAADRVRPVRARGLLASTIGANVTLVNPGTTAIALPLVAARDAVVDSLDLSFSLGSTPRTGLGLVLAQPAGSDEMSMPPSPAYESSFDYMPGRTTLAGAPVAAAWQAVFSDNGAQGSVTGTALVASYHGGPLAPFAQTMSYVSTPHATDGAMSIDAVAVTADLHGAALTIEVRTAPDPDSLAAAAWTAVASGDTPAVTADALVQYRLTIVGDGWAYPTVDRVEIDYTAPP